MMDVDIDIGTRVELPLPELGVVRSGTVAMVLPEGECLVWWDHAALTVVDPTFPDVAFLPPRSLPHGS